MKLSFWPFQRKPPILHRALGGDVATGKKKINDNKDDDGDDENVNNVAPEQYEESGLIVIEDLATKKRVKKRDNFQRNALHVACMNKPSLDVIHRLVGLYPKAVEEFDKVGRLPLHLACSHRASFEVVEYLIDRYPEGVIELTDRGITPLFCALENKGSIDVVSYLLDNDQDAMALESYKLGRTPLHIAAGRGASIDVIQLLIRLRPGAVHEKDAWGKTPFACACAAVAEFNDSENYGYISELLHLLRDNKTISDPDRSGMLPLHIACLSGMNIENIEYLLDEYPEAICTPDNNGRLPFHAACTTNAISVEVLDLLAAAFPEALRTFDKQGAIPLHIALQRKLPSEIIMYLMDKEIGAVRTREASTQMYPLHIAARAGADTTILERIADVYPQAIDSVDSKGNTIFHLACTLRQLTVEFAEMLLDRCDAETVCKVNEDESLPLHLAVQHRASWPVLRLLIDLHPEGLLVKDKKGNIPLHKAFQTSTEMYVLVRLAQQNRHQLSKRNEKGCKPHQCASLVIQKNFRRARLWYNIRKAYCPICIRVK